jgi:hypothetical protein
MMTRYFQDPMINLSDYVGHKLLFSNSKVLKQLQTYSGSIYVFANQ